MISKVVKINDSGIVVVDKQETKDDLASKSLKANQAITRLAGLSSLEYQLCRADEAKALGLKVDALDKYVAQQSSSLIADQMKKDEESKMFPLVTSWHEPVALGELLDEIESIFHRYTVLEEQYAVASALWSVFTWVHDKSTVSPILNISSPEKRCGKSTLLDLIEGLVCRPLPSGNITTAALYRSIDKWSPTLVIDEADTFLNSGDDMRGIINSGHYKTKAYVIRCDGDDNVPKRFTTWCPKVIAGIGCLAETVMDRSIIIVMKRKLKNQTVELIRHKDEDLFAVVCQKLKRWSEDNAETFQQIRPDRIDVINDRANDNWEPLLAVASMAGEEWKCKAYMAAVEVAGIAEDAPSIGEQLLTDILDVFANSGGDNLSTAQLIRDLCIDEEKPWASFHRGQNITPYVLGQMLKPFGIRSQNIRFSIGVKKGFYQADFEEAVSRYAPEKAATPATEVTGAPGVE